MGNPPREDPQRVVRDTRRETATRSDATERSRGTEETRESIREERTPIIQDCRGAIHDGDEICNGCAGDRFSTVRPDARCDALCQRYNECEKEAIATAREEVRAETERSQSLTGDGERGQVQMQLRDPRATDREREERYASQEDGRDERGGYDERDARIAREREERYARDERDERSIQTRANEIREEMARPDPRNEREEMERRDRVDHDMRGRIDHDRERDSGRRPEPRDTRIETRLERDQRRRNDTGIETDSARRIQAPRDLRSSDGSGRRVGHLDEPMIDVPPRFKCNGTRSMPSCSSVA